MKLLHTCMSAYFLPGKGKFKVSFALFALLLISWISSDFQTTPYPLKYPANFGGRFSIPSDNPLTKEGVYLGRKLFYETRLSSSNKISCGSCHQQNKAFTDGKAFSLGDDETLSSRNSMSLVNLLWTRKFFWDGRSSSLEEQALFPLTNPHEMGQSLEISVKKLQKSAEYSLLFKNAFGDTVITANYIIKAIAQFERTLISANSKYDQFLNQQYQPTEQELQGMALFMSAPQPEKNKRGANCAHCHGGVKTYMEIFHNNGLDSNYKDNGRQTLTGLQADHGRFKIPTLRNIALTAPYMHDGRFNTLEEVVEHYNGHLFTNNLSSFLAGVSNTAGGKTLGLSKNEKTAIIAFLNMLTDSSFVNNPDFSDPNKQKQIKN